MANLPLNFAFSFYVLDHVHLLYLHSSSKITIRRPDIHTAKYLLTESYTICTSIMVPHYVLLLSTAFFCCRNIMDHITSTTDTKLMQVIYKGIHCTKCNCDFATLWNFRHHLPILPCLGPFRLFAVCNDCQQTFTTWMELKAHYEESNTQFKPIPAWVTGRIIPPSEDTPLRKFTAPPSLVLHLGQMGKYWTYETSTGTEYVYRPHQ